MITEKQAPSNESQKQFSIIPRAVIRADISATARVVYAEIASYYWGADSKIFPSYNRIADNIGMSRRTAIRAVAELVAAGLIEKTPQIKESGGSSTNLYNIIPSDKIVTPPSDKIVTPPSDKIVTPNKTKNLNKNINLKINNTRAQARAKNAAAAAQRAAELERIKATDKAVLEIAKTSKKASWFDVLRIQSKYYLRPKTPTAKKFVTDSELTELIELIATKGGSCRALQSGQHYQSEEVLQNE